MKTTITKYTDLEKTVRVFASGTFNVLFIIGGPGQSKSTIVKKVLPKAKFIKGGSVTPFQFYRELWNGRNQDFILDDVEQMYRDRALVQLLKALCETEEVKSIQWMTAAPQLDAEEIPKEFTTRSRVVIILNDTSQISSHLQTLEDRGLMVFFRPPVEEVIAVGRKFVKDKDVIKFVVDHRPYIDNLSLRSMMIASQMKSAGLDWEQSLIDSLGIKEILMAKEIWEDASLVNERDKIAAWSERTGTNGRPGLGRATFFVYKRRYEQLQLAYAAKGGIKPKRPRGRTLSKAI